MVQAIKSQKLYKSEGTLINKQSIIFYRKEEGGNGDYQFDMQILLGVLFRSLMIFLNMINFFMIYIAADDVGINSAAILSLNSMSTFGVALLFYIFYKERLKKKHLAGLMLMVAPALVMGLSKLSLSKVNSDSSQFQIIKPFLLVLLQITYFSFN